ncbi:MAG: orotidine-5'-phosphate decarboxylase [Longimicrobiales bacterium]
MAEVIVALDYATGEEALGLVDALGSAGDFYKVGLELFSREGPEVVEALTQRDKRVFLDLKLHDIPNTVARSVAAAGELGVDFLTVHTTGGVPMMAAAAEAAGGALTLLGVTVLTSMSVADVEAAWGRELGPLRDEVVRLAGLAREAGVGGVVASPMEARSLKRMMDSDLLVVTPGIRLGGDDHHDQARVTTPADAVDAGADYLVVGRSITRAPDPVAALALVRGQVELSSKSQDGARPGAQAETPTDVTGA